ncbi:MAG: hypothetical protein IPK21_17725 [Haliscomenobacter sp.]|nr:hypothetical protein [Haliscomenobacter sp.]
MKSRILLKEIPSGKFHSAIFATYSINLYYLEQQVLPLLGSKGIHYVSILADGAMLTTQSSGNLTTSGHGKNLEVWNAVYVNSLDDAKYGLVIQAWNYMKQLHADLGDSANNKLKSIEENCFYFPMV